MPVGVSSFTDRTLPHLFPIADEELFRATVEQAVDIERPPADRSSANRRDDPRRALCDRDEWLLLVARSPPCARRRSPTERRDRSIRRVSAPCSAAVGESRRSSSTSGTSASACTRTADRRPTIGRIRRSRGQLDRLARPSGVRRSVRTRWSVAAAVRGARGQGRRERDRVTDPAVARPVRRARCCVPRRVPSRPTRPLTGGRKPRPAAPLGSPSRRADLATSRGAPESRARPYRRSRGTRSTTPLRGPLVRATSRTAVSPA